MKLTCTKLILNRLKEIFPPYNILMPILCYYSKLTFHNVTFHHRNTAPSQGEDNTDTALS